MGYSHNFFTASGGRGGIFLAKAGFVAVEAVMKNPKQMVPKRLLFYGPGG
jgi:hypothetical protein